MDDTYKEQMSKMIDVVQPHCDEEIIATMTCSHSGSTTRTLITKIFLGGKEIAKFFLDSLKQ